MAFFGKSVNFISQKLKSKLLVCLSFHYSRFEVFLFKNCMYVKTVQVGWFAIKTIISILVFSFKKVLKKCENFPDFTY